jgi:hypothetical protein
MEGGIYLAPLYNSKVYNLVQSGSPTNSLTTGGQTVEFINCTFSYSTALFTSITPYSDAFLKFTNYNQVANDDRIYSDGVTALKQAGTRPGYSGYEWIISLDSTRVPQNMFRFQALPIRVVANKLVTVRAYVKKDDAPNVVEAKLVMPGGMIPGVDIDETATKADTTTWDQLSITFTPTQQGFVAPEIQAWYKSGNSNVRVDSFEIMQAV